MRGSRFVYDLGKDEVQGDNVTMIAPGEVLKGALDKKGAKADPKAKEPTP